VQKYQEQQYTSSLEEEHAATRRKSVDIATTNQVREEAYRSLSEQVTQRALYLMNIFPWKPSVKRAQAVINFVLHPFPLEDVTKLLYIR
jgi:hypothetical protein